GSWWKPSRTTRWSTRPRRLSAAGHPRRSRTRTSRSPHSPHSPKPASSVGHPADRGAAHHQQRRPAAAADHGTPWTHYRNEHDMAAIALEPRPTQTTEAENRERPER